MSTRNTIALTTSEYTALRTARMSGKFNFNYTRNYASHEVSFDMPRGAEQKFCEQIGTIVDFGTTSASEVFNLTVR